MRTFEHELQTGGRRLRGTRLVATIPITQAVLDTALSTLSGAARGVRVEIHDNNRIVVHYGPLNIDANLLHAVNVGPSPTLTVTLASTVVAWTLKQTVRAPGVSINGKQVTIDLGALPALRPYRHLLHHVKSATLATRRSLITVGLEVFVE